ncbi:RNA exonuclease 1 homolog [Hemibagrus wyckioides]|uniref:RNA exonuclease 1 homolog n=1 Tax=Hemibagrus wyckioides TaxID=337641 RepID=UPI00266C8439|nr:RNA exonuclease 1 homolog [Hemibagrus wyckioides]
MFPSAGLFSKTECPFLLWGGCERPYCPYKHHEEDSIGACARSARATAEKGHGNPNAASRTFHNQEQSHTCLSELERINKQIEAVKNEVEKEQKRLSRYQSEQAEIAGASSEEYLVTRKTQPKDQNGNQLKCKKDSAAARKYVVDRTKPKTDLEYDPCSNFSADMRFSSSTDKIKSTSKADVDRDQQDKGKGKSVSTDPVPIPSCNLEDSDEEGELVIDIPPFENDGGKGSRIESSSASENANFMKTPRESSEMAHLDTDMPLLEKIKPANKGRASINEQEESHKSLYKETDSVKRRHSMLKRENISSERVLTVRSMPTEGEQKPSVHPRIAKEEPESSKMMMEIDASLAENNQVLHKSLKPNLAASKNDKCKEEILNYATGNSTELHENARLTSVAGFSQVCQLEKPPPSNSMNTGVYEEKAQNIETLLDDISICLDHLRRESESIACLQDVDTLLSDNIQSAPSCSKIQGDHLLHAGTQRLQSQTEPVVQANNWLSGHVRKMDTLPVRYTSEIPQKTVFQDYLLTTSSYPDITKDPGSCPSPSTSVETNWPFAHKVATEPVQNVPLYISGTNTTMVPSPHVELNPAAAPMELMGDQNLQKPAALLGTTDENMPADSSSSEELNYSDLDLSESDPMEECYRIFMEANKAEDPTVQGDMPEEVSKVSEAEKVKPGLAQKKRVAHIAKFEVSKSKAQVMVPLRDGGSQLTVPTRSQQCQKRAISLTAAVKGCQSFIAANAPKRALAPTVIHSPAMPNNYVNILPAGATMRIGPNLHLIVPEGTCALPVAIIPTAAPVIRPVLQPAQISQPMQSTQLVNYTPAKSIPTKRKAKGRAEVGLKVPHDVRQRYVNLFVEEFLKTSATVQDAFEKALAEEKTVFDRSVNKLKYLSIAVNALKRLKNQNAAPAKFSTERDAQASRGNVPLNTQALLQNGDTTLYDQLKEHILTKALLRENNYPHKLPDKPGFAIQYGDTKKGSTDVSRRLCCRCGTSFSVSQTGKHTRKEECNYHYGKVLENRVPGGVETRYSCCENAIGSPGCQVFKLHVHDAVSLQGFISSLPQTHQDCPGIYAIDTDVCYTTQGLELARVTVVNSNLQVVYDTFVKPTNEVIDYNTRFSGVSEDDVKNSSLSLQDVQTMLLSFISERTILVGHSLENDLCALKLIHNKVVDTSVVFPHRLGPPHKRDLRSLTAEYLRKIIQESVDGHDTQEDATACMELVLWKVKEDAKGKKW